ncbi:hypothetical protein BDD14_2041 [Edaphobacter modestus]|uniref:Uncharacterized protein n=2 Tax=Edaphobacter modestus TaxID=388466 RepID=A0A4Q7YRZ0_9BACT|nr:hypothetical protein BDD14_2041 [Edaphobacter modestus]
MIFGMWLQDPGSISSGNSRLLMFFVAMVAVAMVAQAVVVVVAALGAAKAGKRLLVIAEEVRAKALPVIDSAQGLAQDLQPKIRVLAENLVETSHVVRAKAVEFDSTISEVNSRARAQTVRVDSMVTSVLDTTESLASTIQNSVKTPVREFQGLMNGLKAGIDVLVGRRRNHNNYPAPPETDGNPVVSPFSSGAKRFREEDPGL